MKFVSSLIVLATLDFVLALQNSKKFSLNSALKTSLLSEKVERIQNFYNNVQTSNTLEVDITENMSEVECIDYYLETINQINNITGFKVQKCNKGFQETIEDLEKSYMEWKALNDDTIAWNSERLTSCEWIEDVELGLQCQADKKGIADNIKATSNIAIILLQELQKEMQAASDNKFTCIYVVVNNADKDISEKSEKLVLC